MNSAKTLLVVGVLGAVGVAAYLILNAEPPPEMPNGAQDWAQNKLNVDNIDQRSTTPGTESFSASTGQVDTSASPGGEAPRFEGYGATSPAASPATTALGAKAANRFNGGGGSVNRFNQPVGHGAVGHNHGTPQGGSHQRAPGAGFVPPTTVPHNVTIGGAPAGGLSVSVPGIGKAGYGGPTALSNPPRTANMTPVFAKANDFIGRGELAEALELLSEYHDKQLSETDRRNLTDLLDRLAGTVIYSRQHILEPAHIVRAGQTLQTIATRYQVPWRLLAKINGVADPNRLPLGSQLKVVRGPFSAIVQLEKRQLVLMLGGRYAGRFPIEIKGSQPTPKSYVVRQKTDASSPWLELDSQFRICGVNSSLAATAPGSQGCAVLSRQDCEDVFDILQISSQVTIRR